VQVAASVQLTDLSTIRPGDEATLTPSELPGETLTGRVLSVGPSATGGGLQGVITVQAANLPARVPLGTQVYVTIDAAQRAAVAVPSIAVLDAQLAPMVLVVRDGRVVPTAVTIGTADAERTAILSGLSAGEEVAVSNMQSLGAGERVRVTQRLR
ncbi:MAG TPA: hypothetical protein VMD59_01710, partial [Acidimicrobiales bacterium]|nr:hypothetical protein [Acidimicrobiales bacterium]